MQEKRNYDIKIILINYTFSKIGEKYCASKLTVGT